MPSDKSTSVARSLIALYKISMSRYMSTLCLNLKISQKSVLRQMLSQNLYVSVFAPFAGIAML